MQNSTQHSQKFSINQSSYLQPEQMPLPETQTEESINLSRDFYLERVKRPHSRIMPISVYLSKMLQSHKIDWFDKALQYTQYKIFADRIVIAGETQKSLDQCQELIQTGLIKKLVYIHFNVPVLKDVYSFLQTPTLLEYYKNNHFTVIADELTIYLSSFQKSKAELSNFKDKILSYDVWCYQWRNPRHQNPVYLYATEYLQGVLKLKKDFFKQRDIKVQINTNRSQILMIGASGHKKMQVKNTIVNIHHSTIIMQIEVQNPSPQIKNQFKKLSSYVKKVTDHPVILRQTSQNHYVFITKDNIARQLLSKSKFRQLFASLGISCGFFFLQNNKTDSKRHNLQKFVSQHQYFLQRRNIYNYVTDCMSKLEQSGKSQQKYINFIIQILNHLIEYKPKVQVKIKKQQINNEVIDSNIFIETGDKIPFSQTQPFCQLFGCDLMMYKVYLNRNYIQKYQQFADEKYQSTDITLFTIQDYCDQEKTQTVKIQKHKMSGKYYYGKVKEIQKEGRKLRMYLPQFLVQVV